MQYERLQRKQSSASVEQEILTIALEVLPSRLSVLWSDLLGDLSGVCRWQSLYLDAPSRTRSARSKSQRTKKSKDNLKGKRFESVLGKLSALSTRKERGCAPQDGKYY